MNLKYVLLHLQLASLIPAILCVEPLSGAYAFGAVVASLGIATFTTIRCRFYECCDDQWINNNVTGLEKELEKRLYGQHLVQKVVASHIKGHVTSRNPPKALVLCFHGPTGTGKNHVSRMIAELLYREGLKSSNVKLLSATKEFPHKEMVPLYKDRLRDIVEKQVKSCPQSLFIFDEIDKMPGGLLDTIKPYLDYHEQLDGVDYRHAIFVFLSNEGGTAITEYILNQWKEGTAREDIQLKKVERILSKAAINSASQGGLYHSGLISNHLITAFLPFLPLERKHVRQCVRDMMVKKEHYPTQYEVPADLVEEVIAEMTFFPDQEQLFSVTGCKRVAEKVDYVMLN